MQTTEIRHGHLFCGIGAGARGFNAARPRVGNMVGRFRCLGGIDVDRQAIEDFGRLTGVPGTVLDLFDRSQYMAFHGREPGPDWREATPADIHRAMGYERPHIWFLSAPCKGFSGLLSEGKSKTDKYQALNRLTLRGVWLALEAYKDDPVEMILFENVPRIATRGRHLLDQITGLLRAYGYAVAETTHDCGEIGGLAQSRKRFLLVARHQEKVPPFLYEPDKKPLRAVGDVLGRMPMPGAELGGPMHRIPALQWKTWVRLAFVEAGSDWRSLNKLAVEDGHLRDFLIVPEGRNGGFLGLGKWNESRGTITGRSLPNNGDFAIADPRQPGQSFGKYAVTGFDNSAGTVISGSTTGQGAFAVADPRPNMSRGKGDNYLTGGHYGVVPWAQPSYAVSASACLDNGHWSVADPRPMPAPDDKLVCRIQSLDNTWHRPFTTLELAALQSLFDPEEWFSPDGGYFTLAGNSDQRWREGIGNAVPSAAATGIAEVMGETLLLAWAGETFQLSMKPIWVQPLAVALSVRGMA